jgi:hypothetical protein
VATQQVFSSTHQRAVRLDVPHGPEPPSTPVRRTRPPPWRAAATFPQCHCPNRSFPPTGKPLPTVK